MSLKPYKKGIENHPVREKIKGSKSFFVENVLGNPLITILGTFENEFKELFVIFLDMVGLHITGDEFDWGMGWYIHFREDTGEIIVTQTFNTSEEEKAAIREIIDDKENSKFIRQFQEMRQGIKND